MKQCPKCGKEMEEQPKFKGLWMCVDYRKPLNDVPPYRYKCTGTLLTSKGAKAMDEALMAEFAKRN